MSCEPNWNLSESVSNYQIISGLAIKVNKRFLVRKIAIHAITSEGSLFLSSLQLRKIEPFFSRTMKILPNLCNKRFLPFEAMFACGKKVRTIGDEPVKKYRCYLAMVFFPAPTMENVP